MKCKIIPGDGPPCPSCTRPMQIREHPHITARHFQQPFYYIRWFRCLQADCATTNYMDDQYRVWNDNPAATRCRAKRGAYWARRNARRKRNVRRPKRSA